MKDSRAIGERASTHAKRQAERPNTQQRGRRTSEYAHTEPFERCPRFRSEPSEPGLGCRSLRKLVRLTRGSAGGLLAAAEDVDHGFIECGNIVGLAGGNKVAIDDRWLVDPLRAGVMKIGFQRRPGSDFAAASSSRFDNGPWAMTDGGYGLAGVEESFHEIDSFRIHAKPVGIGHATGQ